MRQRLLKDAIFQNVVIIAKAIIYVPINVISHDNQNPFYFMKKWSIISSKKGTRVKNKRFFPISYFVSIDFMFF